MKKTFPFVRHAITMVGRTRRSYSMLSLTVVLSFSMLLGYLGWTDSSLYNRYKSVFHQDRNLVFVQSAYKDRSMNALIKEKALSYGTAYDMEVFATSGWHFASGTLETLDGKKVDYSPNVTCIAVPRHGWMLYTHGSAYEVTWLDGKAHQDYDLKSGEIIMDENLFLALGLDGKTGAPEYFCNLISSTVTAMDDADEPHITGHYTVVGTIPSHDKISVETNSDGTTQMRGYPQIVFSMEDVNPEMYPDTYWESCLAFYTDNPENVAQLAKSMKFGVIATYEAYNEAMVQMRTRTGTKAAIAAALLVLLGINLYGSFANALNDRKFEIGVKRAVGASGFQIVRQFLYESLFVMAANILLSVWLVLTAGLTYKVIYEHIPDEFGHYFTFTLYISPASIAMFAACSIALTVVFSLIFSYKSTQVQVVDYLKAE